MLKQFLAKLSWPFRFRLSASFDFGYQDNYTTPGNQFSALEHAIRLAEPATHASTIVAEAKLFEAYLKE